jgi:hemoglobin
MDPVAQIIPQVGEDIIRQMVASFYRRVREDDIIGPMYPQDDWAGAEERLAGFLIYRLGGSPAYLQQRGHPRLRMRHFPFTIGIAERDRWLKLMGEAMEEVAFPPEAVAVLSDFFVGTADMLRNTPA